jgi:hypothetical protein
MTAVTLPDHVDIVIHNYRWWLDLAEREPKVGDLEKRLARPPPKLSSTVAEIRSTLGNLPYEATCRVRPTPAEKTSAMMQAFSWARANGRFAESWEPMASGGCWPFRPVSFRPTRESISSRVGHGPRGANRPKAAPRGRRSGVGFAPFLTRPLPAVPSARHRYALRC